MKLFDLKQLIKEELENLTKEDMVYEATVFHPIEMKKTIGVYKNKIDAKRRAAEALKEYETQLEEVKSAMEEFRKSKAEIEEKKKAAKEKIEKMK